MKLVIYGTRSPAGFPNPSSRSQLAERGDVKGDVVADAIDHYGIDTEVPDPREA